jgi:hypothetical protein
MLKNVIDYLNVQLTTLNLISEKNGLCEIINDGDRFFPAYYCDGNYTAVSEYSNNKGVSYFRLDGPIGIDQNSEDSGIGCDVYTKKTYPLRLVICIKKDTFNTSQYSEELLISDTEKVISFRNNSTLCSDLNMDVVSCISKGSILDRNVLFKDEYNIDNKIGYEYLYIALLIDVIIEGNLSCQDLNIC